MSDKLVVRKSNEIVQDTINKFSRQQNKLMCVLLGKFVNLSKNECLDTEIKISDIREILEITDGGNNYDRLRSAIRRFGEVGSVGCREIDKNGKSVYVWRPYFSEIRIEDNKCIFSWNDKMKPYLLNLQKRFTQYISDDYLKLKSIYGQNLYEQMKSYHKLINPPYKEPGIVDLNIEYLRTLMRTEDKYAEDKIFRRDVINVAVKDINTHTDIYVEASRVRNGKITFVIKSKKEYFDYNGCWLSGDEINDIIYTYHAKSKIYELGKIKKENKQYYALLRQGNKSDYEIILNFIGNDKKQSESLKTNYAKDPDEQTHFEFNDQTGEIEKESWFPFE